MTGLVSDTTPTNSKTWNWNCSNSPCTFRSVINRSPTHTLSGTYNTDSNTTKALNSGEEEGIYYLHVQAKDSSSNESDVKTVSFILQRPRDFVSTLTLILIDPDDPDGTGTPRHPADDSELPLYPENNPKIKVQLDGADLEADDKIQFYSSLTCNSSRTLSNSITLVADDTSTADENEDTIQGVNINLHPGVHEIYAGAVHGNNLQCSRENLEYIVYNPIVAGHEFTCHLTSTSTSGQVSCWGSGDDGRLGSGGITAVSSPTTVDLGQDANSISIRAKFITTGSDHACAILEDNTVKCWGEGSYGRLGTEDDNDIGDSTDEIEGEDPVSLGTGRVAKVISAGGRHTCAILDNDDLKCWGRNNEGQLGLAHNDDTGGNTDDMGDDLEPVNLGEGRIAKAIATGENHTCAILDNSDVKCWGRNNEGQLGLGDTNDRGDASNEMGNNLPKVNLGASRTAKAIAAGGNHTCAILDDDSVKCWGENNEGQLGLGSTTQTNSPSSAVAFGTWDHDGDGSETSPTAEVSLTAKAIAAGEDHTCAILSNAENNAQVVKCWGLNDKGQLGQDNVNNYGGENVPVDSGTDDVDESDIAEMAVVDLGDNSSDPYSAIAIAAGDKHTCVSLNSIAASTDDGVIEGHVKCWGHNNSGQLAITVNTANQIIGDGLSADDGSGTEAAEMGDTLGIISGLAL